MSGLSSPRRSRLSLLALLCLTTFGLLPSSSLFFSPFSASLSSGDDPANAAGLKIHQKRDWLFTEPESQQQQQQQRELVLQDSHLFKAQKVILTDEDIQHLEEFDDIIHPITTGHSELIQKRAAVAQAETTDPGTTAEAAVVATSEAPTNAQAAAAVDSPSNKPPKKADEWKKGDGPITNSQIVLLVFYVAVCAWVGFWEVILAIRMAMGKPKFPHAPIGGLVMHSNGEGSQANGGKGDGAGSGKGEGEESSGGKGEGGGKSEGATTFVPVVNLWTYTEEYQRVGRAAVLFGTIILLFYLVDGPRAWHGPDNRAYNRDLFMFICTVIAVMGFLTIRDTHKKNSTILNREQTEEWKGYMQIGFVLYHYFAAKETYNIIRIFIAAYVWMTGFGNFSYFWIRKDYSFVRIAKMLIRLNWLVFFVCVVMDKDYMLYYVCPLHTFYFITVYATMAIMPEKNYEPFWMRIKFALLFLFLFILFEIPGVFQAFWRPLHILLKYEDSLHEWEFRAGLDHYCALFGMLYAYNYPAVEAWLKRVEQLSYKHEMAIKSVITTIALVVGIVWTVYCVPMNKYSYNAMHPYVSIIPVTCYIIIRNISLKSRVWILGLFQWSGRITLETYIAQFHLWLVNDAKGRLVYIDGYPLINFVIATSVYLLVSSLLFDTTVVLNDALIPQGTNSHNAAKRLIFFVALWIGVYSLIAVTRLI